MTFVQVIFIIFGCLFWYLTGLRQGRKERKREHSIDMILCKDGLEAMKLRMIHIRNLYMTGKSWSEIRELVWIGVEEMIELSNSLQGALDDQDKEENNEAFYKKPNVRPT